MNKLTKIDTHSQVLVRAPSGSWVYCLGIGVGKACVNPLRLTRFNGFPLLQTSISIGGRGRMDPELLNQSAGTVAEWVPGK